MSRFELVVAADRERGIGRGGGIPWRLPGDMAHFVALTRTAPPGRENAVIMGRRTWESIPGRLRPLAGRRNIVLSRDRDLSLPDGVARAADLEGALAAAAGAARVFVIGGAEVYAQALAHPGCGDVHLTAIHGHFECDTFLPELPPRFARVEASAVQEENGITYRIERWSPNAS